MGDWIMVILRALLCFIVVGGVAEYGADLSGFGLLLTVVLLSIIVTLMHELGHAFAVWWQGGTVLEICVFGLSYRSDRWRLSFGALPPGGDLAGFVDYEPPQADWTRRQYAIVAAGGPLADVALGILALVTVALVSVAATPKLAPTAIVVASEVKPQSRTAGPAILPSSAEMVRIFAAQRWERRSERAKGIGLSLALLAFASAILNLLPHRGSDGARLVELWRGRNRFAKKRDTGSNPG